MRFWLTWLILILLLILAIRRGGLPERIAVAAYVATSVIWFLGRLIIEPTTYLVLDPLVFAIDLMLFAVLLRVALLANRWWPLCACALQLIVLTAHFTKLFGISGMAGVYWGMTTLPVYAQLIILMLGIQFHARRVARIGQYPDWRAEG